MGFPNASKSDARDVPSVSVVIPTYNKPAFLEQAIESVFAQTLQAFEVIVIDDGNTDETPTTLLRLSQQYDPRIRVIRQPNAGVGAARNRGIDAARGRYVALLDHDDLWMPEKLAEQVRFMETHPDAVGCVVPFDLSSRPGEPAFDVSAVTDLHGLIDRPLLKLVQNHGFMTTSSVLLFDREKAAGLRYAERRGAIEDVPFYVRLFARGAFGVAGRDVLATYRVHDGGASSQAAYFVDGLRQIREMERAGHFAEFLGESRADLTAYFACVGRQVAMAQVSRGHRLAGVGVYLREFVYQFRQRRWRFLLGFPVVLITPVRFLAVRSP